jgi:MFS family permease
MAQAYGLLPVLLLFGLGAVLLLPEATTGPLPTSSPWPGWGSLLRRGLPWQALAALALASAADAGRAALVPAQLVSHGLDLADIGLLLGAGSSIAGIGFLAFGRLADRAPSARVLGVGLLVLTMGSFGSAMTTAWSPAFALAAAILGIGASGMRLGAEVQLIDWVGPDRAAVAAALGETTVLGGRAVGAPVVGALGTAQGDVYAFGTIGLIGLVAMAPLMLFATRGLATVLASARLRPQVVAHAGSMYPTPCSPACD